MMEYLNIVECSDYDLEEERNRLYAKIWENGVMNTHPDVVDFYRCVALEFEYRDSRKSKATLVAIK